VSVLVIGGKKEIAYLCAYVVCCVHVCMRVCIAYLCAYVVCCVHVCVYACVCVEQPRERARDRRQEGNCISAVLHRAHRMIVSPWTRAQAQREMASHGVALRIKRNAMY
jgi:hypothetical protein